MAVSESCGSTGLVLLCSFLRDIGNRPGTSRAADREPRLGLQRKSLFSFEDSEGSCDKENIPGTADGQQVHAAQPTEILCAFSESPPSFSESLPSFLDLQPSEYSEDSGCPLERGFTRYSVDAFGYFFDSMGADSPIFDEEDEPDSPMVGQDTFSEMLIRWDYHIPVTSSAKSSFLEDFGSPDGFPTNLDTFFEDEEPSPLFAELIRAPLCHVPLSESVTKKAPPFVVYSEDSPEDTKEQIRRRLQLGADETMPSPSKPQSPPVTQRPQPSAPLCPLQSMLNTLTPLRKPFKRPISPKDGSPSSALVKRQKQALQRVVSCDELGTIPKVLTLQRCYSENEASVKLALQKSEQEPGLIGDLSRPFALPLMKGKHDDLKMISPETLADVLQGKYSHTVTEFIVIDCRYPYEFEGGHINGAVNVYTHEDLMARFLPENTTDCKEPPQGRVLVFHCEFSSERGPKMSRFLRNMDRQAHDDEYPKLMYPEIYVLEGGYKAFFESFSNLCVPEEYIPMRHKDYETELKEFKARSKSGNSQKGRSVVARSAKRF